MSKLTIFARPPVFLSVLYWLSLVKKIKKIVIIGPESTGKSTLSKALATHYQTVAAAEYARAYLEQRDGLYQEPDLLQIAAGQLASEDALLPKANKLLFCDTDLYVIKVWSEHKYRHCAPSILQTIATRSYDLYLLTDIDMAWQPDPLREYPHPAMRRYFFKVYLDIVQHAGVPFALIKGNPEQRLGAATRFIDAHADLPGADPIAAPLNNG